MRIEARWSTKCMVACLEGTSRSTLSPHAILCSFDAYKSVLPTADENKLRVNAQNVERLIYASAPTEVRICCARDA